MVPEGWKREPLINVAEIRTGIAVGKNDLQDPVELPYLRVANVQDGRLDLSVIKTIKVERSSVERYRLRVDDVLMTEGGDFDKLGRGDVWNGQIETCLHQNHVFCVRPDQKRLRSDFLTTLSGSFYGKTYFLGCAKRSTNLASINSTQLKEFPVLLPPLPEQAKITQILSTWDKATATTEKLIANSKAQKKALMQQLLTGKKRLSGFSGKWKEYGLDQICTFLRGQGLSKEVLTQNGNNKCVLYGELYTVYGEIIHKVNSSTNSVEGVRSVAGDVLIPASTTTTGIDLANAVALNKGDVLLGGDINILRVDRKLVCSNFLAYVLTHALKHDISRLAQGITIIHLYGKELRKIRIFLPSVEEQRSISAMIEAEDKRKVLLSGQLNQLRVEKQALMQQLLTGKRRVKLDSAA